MLGLLWVLEAGVGGRVAHASIRFGACRTHPCRPGNTRIAPRAAHADGSRCIFRSGAAVACLGQTGVGGIHDAAAITRHATVEITRPGSAGELRGAGLTRQALLRPTTPDLIEGGLAALAEAIAAKTARAVVLAITLVLVERAPEQEPDEASDHEPATSVRARDFRVDS